MSEKYKPWKPVEYETKEVQAIQAMARGDATSEQQKMAMDFILHKACGTYEMTYIPDSARDTDFAQGRRFVGLTLVKLLRLNSMQMKS